MLLKYNFLLLIIPFVPLATGKNDEIQIAKFCYNATYEGFRLNTTVYMTTAATHWINCAMECVEQPCCRSINFKKIVATRSERNCEMLHNVVYNTSEKLLENNASYDYIFFNNPRKEYNGTCLISKDIDKCADDTANKCHSKANCTNTAKSYTCKCLDGFYGNETTCLDIDECADDSTNECHTNSSCINTEGSYNCSCLHGFSGDGRNCTDVCPLGWKNIGNKCYMFFSDVVAKWKDARVSCQNIGGYLAIISNLNENNLLVSEAKKRNMDRAWIGYCRKCPTCGNFLSVCGVTPTYRNWASSEPNGKDGDEDCVHLYTDHKSKQGKWNDKECYHPLHYICEFNYLTCERHDFIGSFRWY